MEVKREGVLFINVIYRVILLIGFLSEYEAPNLPLKSPILNWNYALTDRVVLILANGLRDDFLEQNATPFLHGIANENGTFARAKVEGFLTADSSLRTILTGVPGHSSLLFWNRPVKYRTILDFIACICVVGELPLEKEPGCYYPNVKVFEEFKLLTQAEENKDCLYVISFDFGGFYEEEYKAKLESLDKEIRILAEEVTENWKNSVTTYVLTSARGWSLWNRTDENVDVPVLVWGNGILPKREEKLLRLVDVPVLVSSLLGRSFPAGCLGQIPTYLLNITVDARFHMMLYNSVHLEKTMGDADEEDDGFEVRSLKGFVEDEDAVSLQYSVETFIDNAKELNLRRMKYVSLITILSFAFWNLLFMVVIVQGAFSVNVSTAISILIVAAVMVTLTYASQAVISILLLDVLIPFTLHSYGDILAAFRREGHKILLISFVACAVITALAFVPIRIVIISLTFPILLWPFVSRLSRRSNKKVLALWIVSVVTLASLPHFHVLGRSLSPGLITIGVLLNVTFFHFVYHSFKRQIDLQSWLITVAALCSCYRVWGNNFSTHMTSWSFLFLALAGTIFLRGTLLEHHLKFHLLVLVPFQLLSVRHECIFYFALTIFTFSWLFMENLPDEKTLLMYQPSVFSVEKPSERSANKMQVKHYRQVAFFLISCFISFFAAGNLPNVYSYDLNIAKPFGDVGLLFLVFLKFFIPFFCLIYSFLTLQALQKRDPSVQFMLSIYFLDMIASCLLIYNYFFNIFGINVWHYLILEFIVTSITVLYLMVKYIFL